MYSFISERVDYNMDNSGISIISLTIGLITSISREKTNEKILSNNVKFSAVSRASMFQRGVVASLKSLGLRPQEEWPSRSG